MPPGGGRFVWGVSMSNRKWIALGVMTFVMLIGLMFPQKDGSGLTDEQRLEITDKCIQNPDAWYCR